MRKILDLTEMPPVYIPKRRSNLKYAFQEMALTFSKNKRGISHVIAFDNIHNNSLVT